MLHITLFGGPHAKLNGKALFFPAKSVSALLAYLLLERDAPQPRARIATLLWPDVTESKGRRNLRQALLRLRQTIPDSPEGQPPVLMEGEVLQWNPDYPVDVDIYRFERAMKQATPYLHTPLDQTPYPAIQPLKTAVSLYTADLLPDFDLLTDFYGEWLRPWRTKYQRQALIAMSRLAECYVRAGLPHRAEELAQRQLVLDPDREIAHRQLMQVYLAQGEYRTALRHYRAYEKRLQEYGDQPAPPLRVLQQRAKAYREARVAPLKSVPHNLPPERTPFHGRQDELEDLLLALVAPDVRLITLAGLGGIGKTRLALAAARHFIHPMPAVLPRFPGGVWFVSLAEVPDENDDDDTLARVLLAACNLQHMSGESAWQAVIRHLSGEACLLILDNLEHLAGAPAFVARLLQELPNLNVLATSRHPLKLQQEKVLHLQGLPLPAGKTDTDAPSMALLIERLQNVKGVFYPEPDAIPALMHICAALDGWPLAIELAAGWADRLPVAAIAERISSNLQALQTAMPDVPLRHRSMDAVLAGSYYLLTPAQQRILRQFAVFHGGCTQEAAEAILAASREDFSLLVRRALLREQDGRYTIHELIRQFAQQKLEESGEGSAAARVHAQYYLGLLTSLEGDLFGPRPLPAVRQLRLEWENLRAAWHWAIENGRQDLLSAARAALFRFVLLAGLFREGIALLESALPVLSPPVLHDFALSLAKLCLQMREFARARALLESLPDLETLPLVQRSKAHQHWGRLLYLQGFNAEGQQHLLQALALARACADRHVLIESLTVLAELDSHTEPYSDELMTLLDETDDLWLKKEIYLVVGSIRIRRGRYRQACVLWQKGLEVALELENGALAVTFYTNLGDAFRELGDFDQAEASFRKALEFIKRYHYESVRKNALEGWARLCVLRGEYDRAISLAEEAIASNAAAKERLIDLVALNCLGHAHVGLKQWEAAEIAYRRALTLAENEEEMQESLIGMAYVCWKQGDEAEARSWFNRLLDTLERGAIIGYASPSLNYARLRELLRALGANERAEVLVASFKPGA